MEWDEVVMTYKRSSTKVRESRTGSGVELGLNFEDEIATDGGENQIRGPGGEDGGELVGVAHSFEEAGCDPIDDCDSDGDGNGGECAAASGGQREGHGDHGH